MRSSQVERVICGWCRAEFDIDPALAAQLYECPGCGERQVYGALKYANLDSNAFDLSHSLSTAAADHLHHFSLVYTYVRSDEQQIGSGSLIRIGERTLIATTAHTIPKRADRITFVPKLEPRLFDRAPAVLNLRKSEYHDVGLIEVESAAPRLLGMEAVQIDRLADLQAGREGVRCWLIGFPIASARPDRAAQILMLEANSFSCEPIAPIAWGGVPTASDDGTHDPDAHILVHYSMGEPLFVHSDNPSRDEFAPAPFGLSGGGLWQTMESREGRVWSPSMLCLFGIQSSWCVGQEHLKAIQIIHWLHLVAETYPELRDQLCERFPRLGALL